MVCEETKEKKTQRPEATLLTCHMDVDNEA